MKFNSVVCALVATSFLFASCAQVSDVTRISGTVSDDAIEEVNIMIPEVIDTLVPVTDGRFNVEIPAVPTSFASVEAGVYGVQFISDGTPLDVVLSETATVRSTKPSISIQERFIAFQEETSRLQNELQEQFNAIDTQEISDIERDSLKNAAFDVLEAEFTTYNQKVCQENPENILALVALGNLRGGALADEEILALIDGLSDVNKENPFVQHLKSAYEAVIATGEGKMFKDFEVENVYGYSRSADPQPLYETVRFSDFVGKGKYILVDFWSPWCGPCCREIPNIRKVYDKYHSDDFDVLSIAVWERESQQVTMETADKLGVTWNQINNAQDIPTSIYGIQGIPHIMLVGPDGTILKRGLHGASVEEAVAAYVQPVE